MANLIVRCADYNGSKDVLFRMRANDERLSDKRFKDNYTVIEAGIVKDSKTIIGCVSGTVFRVFSDWSIKVI